MIARVKVCCIGSVDEARLAIAAGASAVGLVSAMPSGPGVIDEAAIARIAALVPPGVESVLLTSLASADAIAAQHARCRTSAIQLCDRLEPGAHRRLRAALPGIRLIRVVHVTGEASIAEAESAAPEVDAILLDSGDPSLATKELGGTGRVHDWALSRRIRRAIARPLFLAGGLTADNVRAAVAEVEPYAVDVCSGVRTAGALDSTRLGLFMAAVAADAK